MREWEHIREAWNADVVEPISDFIDAGDRVAVRHTWRVTAGDGPEVNMEVTNVLMVRRGKVVYQEFFWDHAEALETLGLSEQTLTPENLRDTAGDALETWPVEARSPPLERRCAGLDDPVVIIADGR